MLYAINHLELYLDEPKDTYKALNYGRVGVLSGLSSIVSGAGRDLFKEAKVQTVNIGGR